MRSLLARMDVHMRSPMYTSTNHDKMAATASVIGTPRSMPSPLMNRVLFSATLAAHTYAPRHSARKGFAQCTRKLSSAVKRWRPGWSIFLRLLVVPRHTPRWPQHVLTPCLGFGHHHTHAHAIRSINEGCKSLQWPLHPRRICLSNPCTTYAHYIPCTSELQLPMPVHKGLQRLWRSCRLLRGNPHHHTKSIAPCCNQ